MNPDPNNLEGPPRTREEMAENFRKLNEIAPTPAEKLQLMFGAGRPTPITDQLRQTIRELYKECLLCGDGMGVLLADAWRFESLERQLAEANKRIEELTHALRGSQNGQDDLSHALKMAQRALDNTEEKIADILTRLTAFRDGEDAMRRIAIDCKCPSKDAEIAVLKGQLADTKAQLRIADEQLAAKTEECEGWEKQWREAAMNALTDKTRDELAEAREQRDRLADACRKLMSIIGPPGEETWADDSDIEAAWKTGENALTTLNQTTR